MYSLFNDPSLQIQGVECWYPSEKIRGLGILIRTARGSTEAILHQNGNAPTQKGIVWVCGARGGFDGPADAVYQTLAEEMKEDITSLRVNYRSPSDLHESVLDTLVGVAYLKTMGCSKIVLVGHSFGGAVVISAAPFSDLVKAVVALSSQTAGATSVAAISPRPLLLVHGEDDTRLPPRCTEMIYEWAQDPKEKIIYPGAGHGLRECKDEIHDLLLGWIPQRLNDAI